MALECYNDTNDSDIFLKDQELNRDLQLCGCWQCYQTMKLLASWAEHFKMQQWQKLDHFQLLFLHSKQHDTDKFGAQKDYIWEGWLWGL